MEETVHGRRHMFKSKWGKILKHEEDEKSSGAQCTINDDISDFLKGTSRSNSTSSGVSTRPVNSPRIDISIAQRWPDATQLQQQISTGEYKVPSPLPVDATRKPRKRKGLNVRFVATYPEIIGCGGDETPTPPAEIGRQRAALIRSLSDRRPQEVGDIPEADRSGSPLRPGVQDRAQTHLGAQSLQANNEAFNSLASAGVFGDRPPSRDNRPPSRDNRPPSRDNRPPSRDERSPSRDTQLSSRSGHGFPSNVHAYDDEVAPGSLQPVPTSFSSVEDSPPQQSVNTWPASAPVSTRRAVPRIQTHRRDVLPGHENDETLPSEQFSPQDNRIPRILRSDSSDPISETQRRMRVEEAQAFSKAYRLSQTFPTGQDESRPTSRSSNHTAPSPPMEARGHRDRHDYLRDGSPSLDVSAPTRTRPSQSPARSREGQYLHPGALGSAERLTPPITPPTNQAKAGGMNPQDYIEFFKAKTRSRSNSGTNRTVSGDTHSTTRDSPLQGSSPPPEGTRLKVDTKPSEGHWSEQDKPMQFTESPAQIGRSGSSPSGIRMPIRRAVPHSSSGHDYSRSVSGDTQASAEDSSTHLRAFSSERRSQRKVDLAAVIAFEDFSSRVNQMKGIFRLIAEKEQPRKEVTSRLWIRCAHWWLQKAQFELESMVRSRQGGLLTQAHVDLGKAWWILSEKLEKEPVDLEEDRDDVQSLQYHLQTICLWMEKHQVMPPQASLIQGQDARMWLTYPPFTPDLEYLLGCTAQTHRASHVLPLADTRDHFYYQRMPVVASVSTDDQHSDRVPFPCMLSIVRHRMQYRASVFIASQSDLVNVLVGPEMTSEKKSPSWHDISWNAKSCTMSINLPRGVVLKLQFEQHDYRALSNMIEYTRALDKSFEPNSGESLIYSAQLHDAQYVDKSKTHTFPEGTIRRSFIGVFEVTQNQPHENYIRKAHHGFRIMLITPSTSRTLGLVSRPYDAHSAILYEIPDPSSGIGLPFVILNSASNETPWRLSLTFTSQQPLHDLIALFQGTFKSPQEHVKSALPLVSFSAEALNDSSSSNSTLAVLSRLQFTTADILTQETPKHIPVLNPSLRLVVHHSAGTITDRLNFLPGQCLFRLPVSSRPVITLARGPQPDVTVAIDRPNLAPSTLATFSNLTSALATIPTLRTYTFPTVSSLHAFEQDLTGFRVAFDARPSLFSITRRRMVVSLVKKLEATSVRVQVLTREGDGETTRLAAWFEGFPAADCMAFTVKPSDEFERVKGEKGMKAGGVRLVEAKFRLPGSSREGEEQAAAQQQRRETGQVKEAADRDGLGEDLRRFVNLEGLDYMEEHDDIVVGFESGEDLESFCEALPGTVGSVKGFLSKRR